MALDKAIASGKEKRKPYYRSGRFNLTCRPGGSCPYCKRNRNHQHAKAKAAAADQLREDRYADPVLDMR